MGEPSQLETPKAATAESPIMVKLLNTALDTLAACNAKPNVDKFLTILATLPTAVTTATAERSFNTIRRSKTYDRP